MAKRPAPSPKQRLQRQRYLYKGRIRSLKSQVDNILETLPLTVHEHRNLMCIYFTLKTLDSGQDVGYEELKEVLNDD